MVLGAKTLFLAHCHAIMRLNHDFTKLTSAESTPVDRRLGFFFLCTAVRPVVGEPGVSLSPGQLTYVEDEFQFHVSETKFT